MLAHLKIKSSYLFRVSNFGVKDKFTNNIDTIISLVEENEDEGGFHIWAGGHYEDIFDGTLTRE